MVALSGKDLLMVRVDIATCIVLPDGADMYQMQSAYAPTEGTEIAPSPMWDDPEQAVPERFRESESVCVNEGINTK